jgi:hypothetical protein
VVVDKVESMSSTAHFVSLLEQAQTIAVNKILSAEQDLPWVEMDHLISECLANFPLDAGREAHAESELL